MLLTKTELLTKYYTIAKPVAEEKQNLYLMRANAWCEGYIGGLPPVAIDGPDGDNLKTAVALCFEIMARAETHQINSETGDITEVAPPTAISDLSYDELFDPVRDMLRPYKLAYENSTAVSDRGVKFI